MSASSIDHDSDLAELDALEHEFRLREIRFYALRYLNSFMRSALRAFWRWC